jgi:hypothetical protein
MLLSPKLERRPAVNENRRRSTSITSKRQTQSFHFKTGAK